MVDDVARYNKHAINNTEINYRLFCMRLYHMFDSECEYEKLTFFSAVTIESCL